LAESEFFGHAKGAFTGADQAKQGKFAAAGEGTVLLDEIDALPVEQQGNLLRVVETGEFEPVGSNSTELCKARIIAASNTNLEQSVREDNFRQDLYFRLAVMSFHLPPLRERVRDIELLTQAILLRVATRFHREITGISQEAVRALQEFSWPGNIRQLENVVQQAVLACTGTEIQLDHLPPLLHETSANGNSVRHDAPETSNLLHNRHQFERTLIANMLADCNYSRSRVAKRLGVSRVTLYKKMKRYGLLHKPTTA